MKPAQRGFTLIEVLVALVIVAFGMGALMATLTASADTTLRLRERVLAEWVAMNRVTETRLALQPPGEGESSGESELAGRRWRWRQQVVDPGIAGIRRIEVEVESLGDGGPSAPGVVVGRATGFLGEAVAPANGLEPDWSTGMPPGAPPGTTPGSQPGNPREASPGDRQ